jgi:hypothetical protein
VPAVALSCSKHRPGIAEEGLRVGWDSILSLAFIEKLWKNHGADRVGSAFDAICIVRFVTTQPIRSRQCREFCPPITRGVRKPILGSLWLVSLFADWQTRRFGVTGAAIANTISSCLMRLSLGDQLGPYEISAPIPTRNGIRLAFVSRRSKPPGEARGCREH